ncbi:MAG: hypothetical protein WBL31_13160, partial [Ilumatobacteraceae bacterium]
MASEGRLRGPDETGRRVGVARIAHRRRQAAEQLGLEVVIFELAHEQVRLEEVIAGGIEVAEVETTRRKVEHLGQQQVVGTGFGEEATGLGEEFDRFGGSALHLAQSSASRLRSPASWVSAS